MNAIFVFVFVFRNIIFAVNGLIFKQLQELFILHHIAISLKYLQIYKD